MIHGGRPHIWQQIVLEQYADSAPSLLTLQMKSSLQEVRPQGAGLALLGHEHHLKHTGPVEHKTVFWP